MRQVSPFNRVTPRFRMFLPSQWGDPCLEYSCALPVRVGTRYKRLIDELKRTAADELSLLDNACALLLAMRNRMLDGELRAKWAGDAVFPFTKDLRLTFHKLVPVASARHEIITPGASASADAATLREVVNVHSANNDENCPALYCFASVEHVKFVRKPRIHHYKCQADSVEEESGQPHHLACARLRLLHLPTPRTPHVLLLGNLEGRPGAECPSSRDADVCVGILQADKAGSGGDAADGVCHIFACSRFGCRPPRPSAGRKESRNKVKRSYPGPVQEGGHVRASYQRCACGHSESAALRISSENDHVDSDAACRPRSANICESGRIQPARSSITWASPQLSLLV